MNLKQKLDNFTNENYNNLIKVFIHPVLSAFTLSMVTSCCAFNCSRRAAKNLNDEHVTFHGYVILTVPQTSIVTENFCTNRFHHFSVFRKTNSYWKNGLRLFVERTGIQRSILDYVPFISRLIPMTRLVGAAYRSLNLMLCLPFSIFQPIWWKLSYPDLLHEREIHYHLNQRS